MRRRLVIFVKEPHPGRVKTRLGKDIGMIAAAWWFRHQSSRLIRRLSADPRWETWIAVSPDKEGLASRVWPPGVRRRPQGQGDLGDRMGRVLVSDPPGPVVVIGADIPDIGASDIAAAFSALGRSEMVVGPAEDGGYWLIGLSRSRRRRISGLFRDVRWSSAQALADTLSSAGDTRHSKLRVLSDVDTAEDLYRISQQ